MQSHHAHGPPTTTVGYPCLHQWQTEFVSFVQDFFPSLFLSFQKYMEIWYRKYDWSHVLFSERTHLCVTAGSLPHWCWFTGNLNGCFLCQLQYESKWIWQSWYCWFYLVPSLGPGLQPFTCLITLALVCGNIGKATWHIFVFVAYFGLNKEELLLCVKQDKGQHDNHLISVNPQQWGIVFDMKHNKKKICGLKIK